MTFLDWLKQKKCLGNLLPWEGFSCCCCVVEVLDLMPLTITGKTLHAEKKIRNSDQNDYPITQCKQPKRMKTQLAQLDTVPNKSQSKPMWWSTSSVFQIESYICIHLPTAFKTRFFSITWPFPHHASFQTNPETNANLFHHEDSLSHLCSS